jgi:ankyrin repeat protein
MSHQQSVRSHGSRLSTTAAALSRTPSANAAASPSSVAPNNGGGGGSTPAKSRPSLDKGASLEQSVKKFRVVEALRSGDTSSISKAIRELNENGPRPSTSSLTGESSRGLEDTTILHLAIQCAEFPVVEYVLSDGQGTIDVNARDREGNTPLHIAAGQGRTPIVKLLLEQSDINDAIPNAQGKLPIDVARNPDIFQQLQLARSLYTEAKIRQVQELIARSDFEALAQVLEESRFKTVIDINSPEFAADPTTVQAGGTLLHEAARKRNMKLIQVLLLHGGDPFRRDRKGKLPQHVTTDDATKNILKRSPAAVAAQRGIQEKAVLGHAASQGAAGTPGTTTDPAAGREAREMKGYLKKWTNYRKGYQLRWFVLEDGVLSYYKNQDDSGSACRGAINMRIAKLHMSPDEKTKFEIHGKSSVKYTLKANHEVEAKRWFWTLNNSIQWTKDQAREEEKQAARGAELLKQAKAEQSGLSLASQDSHSENASTTDIRRTTSHGPSRTVSSVRIPPHRGPSTVGSIDDDDFADAATDGDASRIRGHGGAVIPGEIDDDDDYIDDSVRDEPSATKDALNITAQSAKLQLETMSHVHAALLSETTRSPSTPLSDPKVMQAFTTYDGAIRSLSGLVGDLLRISKDRDAYWQYRLDREVNMRRMWEESMAQVAREHEALEARVGEAEEKRKLTKRALKEVMENAPADAVEPEQANADDDAQPRTLSRKPTALQQMAELSDSDSEDDQEEFFDAVDAGAVEVAPLPAGELSQDTNIVVHGGADISSSFKGYENGIRHRLKLDNDNRPKVGLWVSATSELSGLR